jgi:hypothetical protein
MRVFVDGVHAQSFEVGAATVEPYVFSAGWRLDRPGVLRFHVVKRYA